MWMCFEQSLVHKYSVTISYYNWKWICVWPAVALFYLLSWSPKHLRWINVRKALKQTICVKGHQVINLFQASVMCLSQSDFVLWISCKTYWSRDLGTSPGVREVILHANLFCMFSVRKTKPLNFGDVTGQGISWSLLILLQKSDFEDWVLSTADLTRVLSIVSLTLSSVPALGVVSPLVPASSFILKGSPVFSKERDGMQRNNLMF